jgi:hypothetical protein
MKRIYSQKKNNKTIKLDGKNTKQHRVDKYDKKRIKNMTTAKKINGKYDLIYTIIEPLEINKRVLDFTLLRNLLNKKYKFQECNQFNCMNKKPIFVWLNYDENSMHWLKRKYYNTSIYLQNSLINTEIISDKDNLHLYMKKEYPDIYLKHLAKSELLTKQITPIQLNIDKIVHIARPINVLEDKKEKGIKATGYGGKDIIIIYNEKTLNNAKQLLLKYDNVLISEYIMDPLLFRNHKFHIRTFLLASILNKRFSTYMLDFGRIFTAKLEYFKGDWENTDIHDTHMKSTEKDWFFPLDFTNANMGRNDITPSLIKNIFMQIRKIFYAISALLSKNVGLYDNVKNGFNIFGIDLMIKEDFTVILIECNSQGTYKSKEAKTHIKLEKILFNWIDNVVMEPLFYPSSKNKTNKKTNKKNNILGKIQSTQETYNPIFTKSF